MELPPSPFQGSCVSLVLHKADHTFESHVFAIGSRRGFIPVLRDVASKKSPEGRENQTVAGWRGRWHIGSADTDLRRAHPDVAPKMPIALLLFEVENCHRPMDNRQFGAGR